MIRPIEPAVPSYRDGAAYSESYGDTYWSLDGGLDETRHVFLSGNDLPARWQSRDCFTILETGFGTGLNFLCTWQLFRGRRRTARACITSRSTSIPSAPATCSASTASGRNWRRSARPCWNAIRRSFPASTACTSTAAASR